MLEADGAQEISSSQTRKIPGCQPNLISVIKSENDLEVALTEIVRILMVNKPKKDVTIAALSKKFNDYYKQPIKVVMRTVCPGVKLIELLQTMPTLHVQKVSNDWHITIEADSVE